MYVSKHTHILYGTTNARLLQSSHLNCIETRDTGSFLFKIIDKLLKAKIGKIRQKLKLFLTSRDVG